MSLLKSTRTTAKRPQPTLLPIRRKAKPRKRRSSSIPSRIRSSPNGVASTSKRTKMKSSFTILRKMTTITPNSKRTPYSTVNLLTEKSIMEVSSGTSIRTSNGAVAKKAVRNPLLIVLAESTKTSLGRLSRSSRTSNTLGIKSGQRNVNGKRTKLTRLWRNSLSRSCQSIWMTCRTR